MGWSCHTPVKQLFYVLFMLGEPEPESRLIGSDQA